MSEETLDEIRTKRILYQELIETKGWAEFRREYEKIRTQMMQGLLQPLASSDLAYAQEFLKGKIETIQRLLDYPQARFEELAIQEQEMLEKMELSDE